MSHVTVSRPVLLILLWTIVMAGGGLLATYGWNAGTEELILLGTFIMWGGSLLATHAWNARTEEVQKSAMINSIASELHGNGYALNNPDIAEMDNKNLSQFVMFPRMHTVVLESAISSGLFLKKEDRLLFTRIVNIYELLTLFNLRLTFMEFDMRNNPQDITLFRTKLRDGALRKQLARKIMIFVKLLMSDYGMKESDVFFVPLEEDATLPRNPKGGPDDPTDWTDSR